MTEWFDKYGLTDEQKRHVVPFSLLTPTAAIDGGRVPEDGQELHRLMVDAQCLRVLDVLHHGLGHGRPQTGLFVVHWRVADKFEKLFVEWFKLGFPLHAVVPAAVCDNDDQKLMTNDYSSGYRPEWGSEHGKGAAGDFGPQLNREIKITNGIATYNPEGPLSEPGSPGMLYEGSDAVTAIRDCGLSWGGGWGNPEAPEHYTPKNVDKHFDNMHVELRAADSKALDKHLPPQLRGM